MTTTSSGNPSEARARDRRPVVVGISRETGSTGALLWAWEEARLRKVPLLAVTAWRPALPSPGPAPRPSFAPSSVDEVHQQADEHLRRLVEAAVGTGPGISTQAIKGGTTSVLTQAAAGAQLLVLGPPHPNRAAGLVSGRRVLRLTTRVACPVVVMPAPNHPD
ncbi:MAG: universal stress protein [Candidatus Dormibacteria bacterium]